MSLIADGLLLIAALTASFYCWSLRKRLKALENADEGLGASIAALVNAVGQTQTAIGSLKTEARLEQERLQDLIVEARMAQQALVSTHEAYADRNAARMRDGDDWTPFEANDLDSDHLYADAQSLEARAPRTFRAAKKERAA